MDIAQLRDILRPIIGDLKDGCTNTMIPELCVGLGMPVPDECLSKRERLYASFDALCDEDVPNTAQRLLSRGLRNAAIRNQIQDLLWVDRPYPEIPKRFRREVAMAMENVELYGDARRFDELLDRFWVISADPFATFLRMPAKSLRADIRQHVHENPGDWRVEYLFDQLGVYEASGCRFALFLEGLASADVRPDEAAQRRFVECVNQPLHACGTELRETDMDGGYPVFTLVSLHVVARGRPKNLIFASSQKPDLRFSDAIDNDIEIVTNADKVLVYDRPIGNGGLRWRDLQVWWSESQKSETGEQAKTALYRRLRSSLPESSPPQVALFDAFYKGFGKAVPDLPALLPEVWLHWDPRTVQQRGRDALLRFRMDFLLLLPHGVRVVVEVDGKQHYAHPTSGLADVNRYAQMVAADRDLKLAGYEVFRFGAAELQAATVQTDVKEFFLALFKRYGVVT